MDKILERNSWGRISLTGKHCFDKYIYITGGNKMNRKGFTLVELLMVVIIIGILVTLAVPSYYKSIERAKGGKAKSSLRTITNAQIQYRALNDTYVNGADLTLLADVDLPAELQDGATGDGDWTYACTSTDITADVLTTATRNLGPYAGDTVTMDQDGFYINVDAHQEWN
ncbi:MAG: prepilin-type N-terminal cleavage/methylation domain-containing protein [Candidatus Omnitrophota bacterium]